MAWNRHHAARLLAGPERALFEASLPDRLGTLADRDLRERVRELRKRRERADGAPRAQMLDEALLRLEKEAARREKAAPSPVVSPHAGRTGSLGARAERPSEGSPRPGREPVTTGRGAKSPSA